MKKDPSLKFESFQELLDFKKITPTSHSFLEGFEKLACSDSCVKDTGLKDLFGKREAVECGNIEEIGNATLSVKKLKTSQMDFTAMPEKPPDEHQMFEKG